MRAAISFGAGALFAVGLAYSGMTHPAKVIGFLDFLGNWDSTLLWVMVGAVLTLTGLRQATRSRTQPLFETKFHLPAKTALDLPLLAGAVSFGVGWGLIGFCPGPALVSLATLEPQVLLFVGTMLAGMIAHSGWTRMRLTKGT